MNAKPGEKAWAILGVLGDQAQKNRLPSPMVLQLRSQDCEVVYRNLTLRSKNRVIFESVSGKLGRRQMVALIGTSGAGKTSLLNSIAGRLPDGLSLNGEILVNGRRRDIDSWPYVSGYVEQEFFAYETQTVTETFLFYIKMRTGSSDHDVVNELLDVLNLTMVRDTMLGSLSGGERKRVSIGVELIGNPSLLFLDEPTSGLDSFNALNILETLSRLVSFGKSILITIHQPSAKMLRYFDAMILMAQGSTIFSGRFEDCIAFFEEEGFRCPEFTNPSDFFLDTISLNTTTEQLKNESRRNINKLREAFAARNVEYSVDVHDELQVRKGTINRYAFLPLYYRNTVGYLRNTNYIKIQILQKIAFILIVGLTYLQLGFAQKDIVSRVGVIYFVLINSMFGIAGPIFNVFPMEKRIINRERKSGCYDGFSAFYAKVLSEIPHTIILNIAYIAAIYWMVNLNRNVGRFFIYLLIQMAVLVAAVCIAFMISTISPSQHIAQVLGSMILIIFIIYGGLFVNTDQIRPWLRWITWLSPVSYGFKASMQIILANQTFTGGGPGAMRRGEDVIDFYGAYGIDVTSCVFVILGYSLLYSLIGASVLHYTTRIRTKLETNSKNKGNLEHIASV